MPRPCSKRAPGPEVSPSRPGTLARSDRGEESPFVVARSGQRCPAGPGQGRRVAGQPVGGDLGVGGDSLGHARPKRQAYCRRRHRRIRHRLGANHCERVCHTPRARSGRRWPAARPPDGFPARPAALGRQAVPFWIPTPRWQQPNRLNAATGGGGGGRGGYGSIGRHDGNASLGADVGPQPLLGAGLPGALPGIGRGAVRAGALDSLSERGAPLPVGIARCATASQPGGDGAGLGPSRARRLPVRRADRTCPPPRQLPRPAAAPSAPADWPPLKAGRQANWISALRRA